MCYYDLNIKGFTPNTDDTFRVYDKYVNLKQYVDIMKQFGIYSFYMYHPDYIGHFDDISLDDFVDIHKYETIKILHQDVNLTKGISWLYCGVQGRFDSVDPIENSELLVSYQVTCIDRSGKISKTFKMNLPDIEYGKLLQFITPNKYIQQFIPIEDKNYKYANFAIPFIVANRKDVLDDNYTSRSI